ncbi:hypothetical protein V8E53_011831 [Lactarius tabidus]
MGKNEARKEVNMGNGDIRMGGTGKGEYRDGGGWHICKTWKGGNGEGEADLGNGGYVEGRYGDGGNIGMENIGMGEGHMGIEHMGMGKGMEIEMRNMRKGEEDIGTGVYKGGWGTWGWIIWR